MTYTILSIDGGGIRGVIPAVVLSEIEARTGEATADLFDLIAGTSTGGILASGLSIPSKRSTSGVEYSAEDVVGIYKNDGPDIFDSGPFSWGLASPKYSLDGLTDVLRGRFGGCMMDDLQTRVVMPTYDLEGRRPVVFTSMKARHSTAMQWPAWKATAATSAAPTYFPPVKFEKPETGLEMACVDGGVYCNNPAALALRESRVNDVWDRSSEDAEVHIVSIGTGTSEARIDGERASNWGLAGWAPKIVQITMDGASNMADRHVDDLAGTHDDLNYWRIQVPLDGASEAMDDASRSNLAALELEGRRAVRRNESTLNTITSKLTQ